MSQPVGDGHGHVTKFRILHPMKYLRNGKKTSNFVYVLATRSTNFQMTNWPLSGRCQGHMTHSRISHLWNISGTAVASHQILCGCRLYQVLARPSLTETWPGSRDPFQNFTPLKFLWNVCRIVKFCARFTREVLLLWWQIVTRWA